MIEFLLVGIGSAAGGIARYGVYLAMARLAGEAFPWGTLAVNILGSAVIGWLAASQASHASRLLLMTGACGGFTTFSAFSLDAVHLVRDGETSRAVAYVAVSITACLAAAWLGARLHLATQQ
jgi:fluoride exporter